MQEVRDPTTSGESGPVSPVKAFLILAAVVAATIGIVIATRPDPPQATDRPTSTAVPTEAEAIAIFNDLHDLWLRSYRERDASLVKLFAAPDPESPFSTITEEIATLRQEGVLDRTTVQVLELNILRTSSEEIRVRQTAVEDQQFVDEETGKSVGTVDEPQQLVIVWELRRYERGWRIYDSLIEEAEPVET